MTSDMRSGATTPAGWYDDGSGQLRWWDGSRWTEYVAPPTQTSGSVSRDLDARTQEDKAALRRLAREEKAVEAASQRAAKLEKSHAEASARKLAKEAAVAARTAERQARVRQDGLAAEADAGHRSASANSPFPGVNFHGHGHSATVVDSVLTLTASGGASRRAIGGVERAIAAAEITALEFVAASHGLDVGLIHIGTSEGRFTVGFYRREADAAASLFEAIRTMAPDAATVAHDLPLYRAKQKKIEQAQEAEHKSIQRAERAERDKEARVAKARAVPLEKAHERALKENAEIDRRKEFERTLEAHLSAAQDAAATGNIRDEEARLIVAVDTARGFGGRKEVRDVEQTINSLSSQGLLRVGSELLGTVEPEGKLDQYNRKGKMSLVRPGKRAIIRSDRILHDGHAYPIDEFTSAQVYLDGIKQITQRPTLTRMALLSPLPGSALVPGLALQKKETNDLRTAEFQITGRGWNVTVPIHPDNLSGPRSIAEQINMITLERRTNTGEANPGSNTNTRAVGQSPVHDQSGTVVKPINILDELTKLQALVDSGMITTEEAQSLKANLMSRSNEVLDRHAQSEPAESLTTAYSLVLVHPGPQKIEVIKTVRRLTAISLGDAKLIVDSFPSTVLSGLTESAANATAEELRTVGAIVELKQD